MKKRKLLEKRYPSCLTVIFKGLDRCNARCSFCSVGETEGRTISLPDFNLVVRELQDLVARWKIESLQFTFHGGEPTILEPECIEAICEAIEALAPNVMFNMQTNLLSMPSGILDLIKRYQIRLGTSVDPLGLDRLDKEGNSLFWGWLQTFLVLAQQGLTPGAIYVVTKHSIGRADEIYSICEAIGNLVGEPFALQINHVYQQGMAGVVDSPLTISPHEYGQFLIDLWNIWERQGRSVTLSPIGAFADYFRTAGSKDTQLPELSCSFKGNCARTHVGIDMNLNVAACGRRLDSKAFLGNLHSDSLMTLLEKGEEIVSIEGRSAALRNIPPCDDCTFYHLCQGGCPDDAWLVYGDLMRPHPWCESYRNLFSAMQKEATHFNRPLAHFPLKGPEDLPKRKIVLARTVAELPDTVDGIAEVWLLPDDNVGWLRFDSGLAQAVQSLEGVLMRLWCRNNQVMSLMLWEDVLQTPGIFVCLFEASGIEQALNVLNSLHATISLDVASIVEQGGVESLERAFERVTSDPLWESHVLPFADMLRTAIEDGSALFRDRHGILPGCFSLQLSDDARNDTIARTVDDISSTELAKWIRGRAECLICRHFRICGTQFSAGIGANCPPGIMRLMDLVAAQGDRMRTVMQNMISVQQFIPDR